MLQDVKIRTLRTVLSFLAELSASLVLLLCLDETELVRKKKQTDESVQCS